MSAYYRTINGQRYDADLLEMAEGLMEGHRDGRLSQADVEALWEAAFDGMGMTAVEMATLGYIRENENPTRPAKEWLDAQGVGKSDNNACLTKAGKIAAENGMAEMRLMRFDVEEISAQEKIEGNKVAFVDALSTAFSALFDPAKQRDESPYNVVQHVEFDGKQPEGQEEILERLREALDYGTLWLVPHDTKPNEDASEDFYPAENGETVAENWVFNLYLDELSDHIYWMIVPRDGGEVYVYGFN